MSSYPFPSKFKFIFENWLNRRIDFHDILEVALMEFSQKSVIGPSLANFILNGLEQLTLSSQIAIFDKAKYRY